MVKKSNIEFSGTPAQHDELIKFISEHKDMKGALMPILQKAQEIYGYLPKEVQVVIADGLDIPLEKVYGVVTFYSQFSLTPKGEYKVGVCLGTACYVKGAGEVYDKFTELLCVDDIGLTSDGKFSLELTRCIGCCGLAPVLTVNEDVYGKVTVDDVAGIIEKYK